jgi:hypothetical protein
MPWRTFLRNRFPFTTYRRTAALFLSSAASLGVIFVVVCTVLLYSLTTSCMKEVQGRLSTCTRGSSMLFRVPITRSAVFA